MTNSERESRLAVLEAQAIKMGENVPPLIITQIRKLKIELGLIKADDDDICLACGS